MMRNKLILILLIIVGFAILNLGHMIRGLMREYSLLCDIIGSVCLATTCWLLLKPKEVEEYKFKR